MSRRSWSDEQLIEAVSKATSYIDVIRLLGLKPTAAGNFRTVKTYITKYDLDTSHFTGVSTFGTVRPSKRLTLDEIFTKNSTFKTHHLLKKLLDAGYKTRKCEGIDCGLVEWYGVPIPLEVDHINGVNTDHRIENLRLLCPNCHALTPTWRGRNRNRAEAQVEERPVEAGKDISSTLIGTA